MGTRGMVAVTRNGEVLAKVLAGLNGYNAHKLEKAFRESPTEDLKEIYHMAIASFFGDKEYLVVLGDAGQAVHDRGINLPDGCFERFQDPRHAPHADNGIAEYCKVIRMESCDNKMCRSCGIVFDRAEHACPECGGTAKATVRGSRRPV